MLRAKRPDRLAGSYIISLFGRSRACLGVEEAMLRYHGGLGSGSHDVGASSRGVATSFFKLGPILMALGLLAAWFLLPAPVHLLADDTSARPPSTGPAGEEPRDGPAEAGSGLLLRDGVVLRAAAGGVLVESDQPGRLRPSGWTGGLFLLFGFALGLAAALLITLYLVRRTDKFWKAGPNGNQAPVGPYYPDLPGSEEAGPQGAPTREQDLIQLLTVVKIIESRLDGFEAMLRKVSEEVAAVNGQHQALEQKMSHVGRKLKRLEVNLSQSHRLQGGRPEPAPEVSPAPEELPVSPPDQQPEVKTQLTAVAAPDRPEAAPMEETGEAAASVDLNRTFDNTAPTTDEGPDGTTDRPDPQVVTEPRPPEDVPDKPGLNLHARAKYLRNLGGRMMNDGLLSGAEANLLQSLAIMKKLADQEPENQAYLRDLVLAYHNQGRVMERMGQLNESADNYQQSIRLTASLAEKDPDCFDWHRGLAASHGHLGRIQAAAGNLNGAEKNLAKDVELMRTLVEKRPDHRPWRYALAGSLHNLALIQEKNGLSKEALRGYHEEMDIMRQLMKEEPDDHVCALNLGTVCCVAGRLLKDMGQMPEALESTLQYVDLMRGLVKRKPDDNGLKRELSVAIGQLGRLWEVSGDSDRALAAFEEALDIRRILASSAPDNDIWQCDLAVGLCKIGDAHFTGRRWDEALNFYREALDIVETLEKKHGPEGAWLLEKCGLLLRIGNYYRNTDGIRALEYYGRALAIAEPRAKSGATEWKELEAVIKENMSR